MHSPSRCAANTYARLSAPLDVSTLDVAAATVQSWGYRSVGDSDEAILAITAIPEDIFSS